MVENILNFFVSNAYADTASAPPMSNSFFLPVLMVMLLLFVYFTVTRPQNKKAKEVRTMLDALDKGDEVISAGGILGKVAKLHQSYVTLTIAENTDILIQKSSIVNVLPKGSMKAIS